MTLSLAQWIEKIQAQHPADIELGLDRVLAVAKSLGLAPSYPQQKLIVIGGTNGKGTTAAILESLAIAHSKRVFCYSSPHVIGFNERIRLNGECVENKRLLESFEIIEQAREQTKLTFFEFTTLAAMLIESEFKADIAIYEIGLGGRLDAVNIMQPDISMITSIGLDHTDWLGDDIEQIGAEKVAIARTGKPLIIADDDISIDTLKVANGYTDKVFKLGTDFFVNSTNNKVHIRFENHSIKLKVPPSIHPKNLAGACYCASKIGFNFSDSATLQKLKQGLDSLFLPGRFETVGQNPTIILDVSHNLQAINHLQNNISRLKTPIKLVCGMLSDKLQQTVLAPLKEMGYEWYLVSLDVPRGATAKQLQQQLISEKTQLYKNVESALNSALDDAGGCGSIVVFGSFYMVEAAKLSYHPD